MNTRPLCLAFVLSMATTGLQAQTFARGANFLDNWDVDGDGVVSLAEVAERRGDIFTTFDADADGVLTAEEFAALNEARAATRDQMQDSMAGMGMGGGMGQGMGGGMGQGMGGGMGQGMGGGMGQGMAMSRGMGLALADAEAFQLSMNDSNGDGQVTRAEFVDRTPVVFNRLDRDGDGRITPDDFGRN